MNVVRRGRQRFINPARKNRKSDENQTETGTPKKKAKPDQISDFA
jgi:hypothetical protein